MLWHAGGAQFRRDSRQQLQFNRRIRVCAGEAGSHVGESPTGRIRRFTTERDVREEAARLNLQAGHLLNQQAITKVNSI